MLSGVLMHYYLHSRGDFYMLLLIKTIAAGLFISLTGSLPLGNLNMSAMQIAAHEGIRKSILFALGVVVTEIIYLRITLAGVSWVLAHRSLFVALQWLSIVFLLLLAAGSFNAARKKAGNKNVFIQNRIPRFLLGLFMSAINPVQFPFWAGWAVVLVSRQQLATSNIAYDLFTLSAGLGTLAALLVFIFFGRKFSGWMLVNHRKVQFGMGIIFLLLAVYQLIMMW